MTVAGLGIGLVFSSSVNTATLGVLPRTRASRPRLSSASQQVGGSLGTALLSTVAASATTSFLDGSPGHVAQAAMHGYTTGFAWAAGLFAAGALIAALLFQCGAERTTNASPEPVLAH